jgi:formylglycine-generating enzyme required for sulfatase activity/tRNA A-37 threonylcarbamoyl transferase component Bud32
MDTKNLTTIGKYTVISELGAGGFGAVYLAEDPLLKSKVAIKVYRPAEANVAAMVVSESTDAGEILKERFINEARTLDQLSHHSHIVNIRELDILPDGTPYYVMPYLPHSLVNEIGRDAFTQGKLEELPLEEHPKPVTMVKALLWLKQILTALAAVHKAGLIHRDIKPANILIDHQGQVQLCDFGIAKLPDTEHSQTMSGVAMGSRNYMSPEQRESAKHANPASDIYAVGVVAYRMLTGTLPIGRFKDPKFYLPELPEDVNQLILDALAQTEAERPSDGAAMLKKLTQALSNAPQDEDEGTIATIIEGPSNKLRDEVVPLQKRIKALLLQHGEIPTTAKAELKALAAIADVNDEALQALVKQVRQDNVKALAPKRNFLKHFNSELKSNPSGLSEATQTALINAGQSVGFSKEELIERIAKHQQINKPKPAQPMRSSQQKASTAPQPAASNNKYMVLIGVVMLSVAVFLLYPSSESEKVVKQTKNALVKSITNSTKTSSPASSVNVSSPQTTINNLLSNAKVDVNNNRLTSPAGNNALEKYQQVLTLSANNSEAKAGITAIVSKYLGWAKSQITAGNLTKAQGYVDKGYSIDWMHPDMASIKAKLAGAKARAAKVEVSQNPLIGKLVKIPSGSFQMGSNESHSEKPIHRVNISSFYLQEHEVTWAQYQQCIDAGACPSASDASYGKGSRPVINVSWNDITQKYIPWLNKQTGKRFRLPTEAEWEYAARAGSTTKYSWGNSASTSKANYSDSGKKKTVAVKSYAPNGFGLYDMHGNVYEWVQDCYHGSYSGAPSNGSARTSCNSDYYVLRGGSFAYSADTLRSAYRFNAAAGSRYFNNGFRLVQDR